MTTASSLPALPALVIGHVAHGRNAPVTHAFRHRVYQWLIDLDEVPGLPWYLRPLATFRARDHLGGSGHDAGADIKTNVERFLAHHGVSLGQHGRVVMLANARVLGYVFDPLTVHWCFSSDGKLSCVVAEVHNTYGERHAYLLPADSETLREDGQVTAEVDKQFYVSPFNDLAGRYALRFELSERQVRATVSLIRNGEEVFDATLNGHPTPATRGAVIRSALRMPVMPQRVSALIRAHGFWLWARGLPIVKRPRHRPPPGV